MTTKKSKHRPFSAAGVARVGLRTGNRHPGHESPSGPVRGPSVAHGNPHDSREHPEPCAVEPHRTTNPVAKKITKVIQARNWNGTFNWHGL